nr:hypothetical protein [Tanacetum cinerariifolium]
MGRRFLKNEASIRHDLRLDDAEGTACLPNAAIFKELARMGKETEVPHTEPQPKEHIPTPSHDLLPSAKIKKPKKRVKKLEGKKKKRTHGLKRLYKERINNEDLFGVNDLDGDEVIVDVTASENIELDAIFTEKKVSVAADEVVTTAKNVKVAAASTTLQIFKDDKPLKKKDQIALDEEVAKKLEAEMKAKIEEEERISREKNEANRAVIEE